MGRYSIDEFNDEFPDINDLLGRPTGAKSTDKSKEKPLPPSLFDPETPPKPSRKPKFPPFAAADKKERTPTIKKAFKGIEKPGDSPTEETPRATKPRKPPAKENGSAAPKQSGSRKTATEKLRKGEDRREGGGEDFTPKASGSRRVGTRVEYPSLSELEPPTSKHLTTACGPPPREKSPERPRSTYKETAESSGEEWKISSQEDAGDEEPPKTVRKLRRLRQLEIIELSSSSESEDSRPQSKSNRKLNLVPESEDEGFISHGSKSSFSEHPGAILSDPSRFAKPQKFLPSASSKKPTAQSTKERPSSPKKAPRIPTTPFRLSSNEFWDQQVTHDWIDAHTPHKTPKADNQFSRGINDNDSENDSEPIEPEEISKPNRPPTKADAALSKVDKEKRKEKKAFDARKVKLAEDFLKVVDDKVAHGDIARLTKSTGGVKIVWNKTLRTTAGMAKYKREKLQNSGRVESEDVARCTQVRHFASIELSEKVVDNEEKLYNTLCHEWCHLVDFIYNESRGPPHGAEFKKWGAKCTRAFSHLNVHVTTTHSYNIEWKYKWQCQNASCGTIYKRHSASIDPKKHKCGVCPGGVLVQTHPSAKEKRPPTEYQIFMKENYAKIKAANPGTPQKEIMKLVGTAYRNRTPASSRKDAEEDAELSKMLGGLQLKF
ncbi:hypothetical protein RUND412_003489 [Rhizina undulata]